MGVSLGYKLEEAAGGAAEETSTGAEAALDERRGGWVERLLEGVRREFSGLPVYVGVEEGYVKRTAPMDQRQFRKYLETCRRLGFDSTGGGRGGLSRWRSRNFSVRDINSCHHYNSPHRPDIWRAPPPDPHTSPLLFMDRLIDAVAEYLCRHRSVGLFRLTFDLTRRRLAEINAVEVVRGAVAPTGARHRGVVAGRSQRGGVCPPP